MCEPEILLGLRKGKNMRILFYRYNSICEPDIIEALEELGHVVEEECTEIYDKYVQPTQIVQNVSKRLDEMQYDCVISVNFYPVLAEICNIYRLRYICWTVDSPILELYSDSLKKEWNRVFLFDYAQYQDFEQENPGHVFYLPLATNVKRWENTLNDNSLAQKNRFYHDISFVGSLYTEKNPYDELVLPSYMKGYFDGLVAMQEQIYGDYLLEQVLSQEIVDEFAAKQLGSYRFPEKARKDERAVIAQLYLGSKIAANERTRLLKRLGKEFVVDLYTGSACADIPVKCHGTVSTHTEMPFIFRDSKINLNMTMRGIRTGIPLRIWDVLGCGGFLLTNYQTEIPEYFTIGEDLDVFYDAEDLCQKVAYYLEHEKERAQIAQKGKEKVAQFHTYTQRVAQMLELAFGV